MEKGWIIPYPTKTDLPLSGFSEVEVDTDDAIPAVQDPEEVFRIALKTKEAICKADIILNYICERTQVYRVTVEIRGYSSSMIRGGIRALVYPTESHGHWIAPFSLEGAEYILNLIFSDSPVNK